MFVVDGKIDIIVRFLTLSSFEVPFESAIKMGWEVKTIMQVQPKYSLWGSNVKTGKYLSRAARGKYLVLFGPKSYNIVSD